MIRLVSRYLVRHPVRSLLTLASMVVAVFLLCVLRSLVVTLEAGVKSAATNRLFVQSAVSLFVDLPISYEGKIRQVEGVDTVCRWQWFGGYYQEQGNFFAQFAVGTDTFFDSYPEIEMVEGTKEAFESRRSGCIIGKGLAETFGFVVDQKVPIIGALYPRNDGRAWEFDVVGIYRSTSPNVDENTLFFHFDHFEEVLDAGEASGDPAVGVYVVRVAPGMEPVEVMRNIDAMFENGPQRVQATPEKEFQAQFVSMVGSVPTFLSGIGAVVLFAIVLAVINTMLMASREQTRDVGVVKALGFTDASVFRLMLSQSLLLCLLGGGTGIALALGTAPAMQKMLGMFLPGYGVDFSTVVMAFTLSVVIGLVAGIAPAHQASRLVCVEALRRGA